MNKIFITPAVDTLPSDPAWIADLMSAATVDTATLCAITVWRHVQHLESVLSSDCQELYLGHLSYAFDCATFLCQVMLESIPPWCSRYSRGKELIEIAKSDI